MTKPDQAKDSGPEGASGAANIPRAAPPKAPGPPAPPETPAPPGDEGRSIKAGGWEEHRKARRKPFAGPADAREILRIAFTRAAYADIVAHAKESLAAEICGVLVGEICADQVGPWVNVEHSIRGSAAKGGGAHVTFTQETWVQIHQAKERDFPKQEIVGWYHSHPGFGVEFSEMDLFIQRHFFSGAGQVALVTDPAGGEDAICVNTAEGTQYVHKFWVEGRERQARAPQKAGSDRQSSSAQVGELTAALRALEDRLNQTLQSVEEHRRSQSFIVMTVAFIIVLACGLWIAQMVYEEFFSLPTPPQPFSEPINWVEVPVQIDGKWAYVGTQSTYKWNLPPKLLNAWEKAVRQKIAAEEAQHAAATQPTLGPLNAGDDVGTPATQPDQDVPAPAQPAPAPATTPSGTSHP